jgi:hypothetical protein
LYKGKDKNIFKVYRNYLCHPKWTIQVYAATVPRRWDYRGVGGGYLKQD